MILVILGLWAKGQDEAPESASPLHWGLPSFPGQPRTQTRRLLEPQRDQVYMAIAKLAT